MEAREMEQEREICTEADGTDGFRMEMEGLSRNEEFARVVVAVFMSRMNPTLEELDDVKTAVSEAVTNAIVHGYKDRRGTVYITAKLFENGKAVVRVRDKGCGIPDIKKAMEPLYTTGGEERAGLGFAVMQSFCDSVRVTSTPGRGTSVTLTKYFDTKQ